MSGDHVTKCGRLVNDVVPRDFICGAASWKAIERQVGSEPRRVLEGSEPRKSFNDVGCEKRWGGEDDDLAVILGVAADHGVAVFRLADTADERIGSNVCTNALKKLLGDPAIAFGPGERTFLVRLARREVVNASPSGSFGSAARRSRRGKGFDSKARYCDSGIGIRSMEERLRLVSGQLIIRSNLLEGSTVEAWVPFKVA